LTVPKDVCLRDRIAMAPQVWTELTEILGEISGALFT